MPSSTIAGLDADATRLFAPQVLQEDLGTGGEVTTALTIPTDARLDAVIGTRSARAAPREPPRPYHR